MPRRTIPTDAGDCAQDDGMHNPEHDSDDEFGDGIDWGDEPEIDAAASCNLEIPRSARPASRPEGQSTPY